MSAVQVLVGLHAAGDGREGWLRILRQEGLPHLESAEPVAPCGLFSEALPDWFESWVAGGGVAVVSGAPEADGVLPEGVPAVISRFRPPDDRRWAAAPGPARLFPGEGAGECRLHEDRKVKGGNDPDVYPLVVERAVGAGRVLFTGVPLTRLLVAAGDRLRRFTPWSEVTERVAAVDKAEVAESLVWMLHRAFRAAGLPYVGPVRFPEGTRSAFLLRVDVDGAFGDRATRLAQVAADHRVRASFFLNGELCEAHPGGLTGWPGGHEIGQHGYLHNVFEGVEDNLRNLERGADWVRRRVGTDPEGFVAPRGLWNGSLGRALAKLGYPYSSDFALDFDSLPFRTPEGVLQIPVHPYSPERAVAHAEEQGLPPPTPETVAAHYRSVLDRQAARRRPAHVYGHPAILGGMTEEVLPSLFARAAELGLPALTLGQLAGWWSAREDFRFQAEYRPDPGRLVVRADGEPLPVAVRAHLDLEVTYSDSTARAPAGSEVTVGVER